MTTNQEGFRFRNDDGTEASATWIEAQDVNASSEAGQNFRLRMLVDTTGAAAGNREYALLYKKSTSAHYARVLTAAEDPTAAIVLSNSPNTGSPVSETTTAQLAIPAGSPKSFKSGYLTDYENPADAVDIQQDGYTELEWCLKAQDGIAQNGDIFQFRVAGNAVVGGGGLLRADNFNRSDEDPLNIPSDAGSAWVEIFGTDWAVSSNRVAYGALSVVDAIAALEAGDTDVVVQATMPVIGTSPNERWGLSARVIDASNYCCVFAQAGTTTVTLRKRVAAANTTIATGTNTNANGDVIKLTVNTANDWEVLINDVSIITANDGANSTGTQHGLHAHISSGPSTARYEDFSITAN